MSKNKKLRLVVTDRYPNKSSIYYSSEFNLRELLVFDRLDYEEISIIGGEPMIAGTSDICFIISTIRNAARLQGYEPKICLYTSRLNIVTFNKILDYVDEIHYTPHSEGDINNFKGINRNLNRSYYHLYNKSLILNLSELNKELLEEEDLSNWKVNYFIEETNIYSVSEDEDLRRISRLI